MRPLFSIWSDYRTPTRKYRMSALARGTRPSIGRKIFLTAVIVTAAAIGVRELYGQAVDKRGLESAAHAQSPLTPSANPTGRRFASVTAIPLSPQPVLFTDTAAVVAATIDSPAPARTPEASSLAPPVASSAVSSDHAIPPALTAVPGALAKAAVLSQPPASLAAVRPLATSISMKSADGPKSVGSRNVVHVAHRTHHDGRALAGYAEAFAARFGHGKELRAALQSFL
jgi:hypothetical protein